MKRMLRLVFLALALAAPACAQDAPRPAPGTRYVYLIRHAIYDFDSTVTDDRLGNGLNALGHEQAHLVGKRLAALPIHFASFVTSDFLRAKQTADDIGAELSMKPLLDSLIHECTPHSNRPDYMSNHPAEEIGRCDTNLTAAWARYARPSPAGDTHDLLVAHGNVIRWLVAKALGMGTERWPSFEIANASITIIAVRPDGSTRLVLFSDVGHLPADRQTWTGRGAGWGKPPARRR
jgi:serine/threonine-protein phosphatase PGAM5